MATITISVQLHANVTEFLKQPRKMLIGGKSLEAVSGKTFDTYTQTRAVCAQL